MKILVVEDDSKLAGLLTRFLQEEGHETVVSPDGNIDVAAVAGSTYDLVILDRMLPGTDGVEVCRRLRSAGALTPILMLSARGEVNDRVGGLDAGADDYLVKPFEVEELLARVRAVTRRATGARLVCGPFEVDRVAHEVRMEGRQLTLTGREFAVLVYLLQNVDRVVSRSELLAHVWGTHHDPGTNVVEVHVSRLREKLGERARMIETVRGRGYRLDPELTGLEQTKRT
jgi:DNA-binding response OmpR family regulator